MHVFLAVDEKAKAVRSWCVREAELAAPMSLQVMEKQSFMLDDVVWF